MKPVLKPIHHWRRLASFLLLIVTVAAAGCGKPSGDAEAGDIYQKAKKLKQQGHTLDAMREFDKLNAFKNTPVFSKAKALLKQEGISISSPMDSWTLKRMFTVKNDLIRANEERHPDGNGAVTYPTTDAWGRSFVVQYSNGPKYAFAVISSGKDRRFDTEDDLKLYHRFASRGYTTQTKQRENLDRLSDESLDSNPPATGGAKNREMVVDLQKLVDS